ncbi:hypothetical protein NCLIV_043790 [Neospora caninum Liverpool]|uniref:tRNA-guanine(15) transglycosylase-like domain-containing protein n=1 Tax=Neospora caninum (strain Liverpool) TaxID=572307 RepID=F0VAQ5_NEOCL|nr:hypothetical protein NCLIV_043790 [Neospora caninum Liverpool]CBZ51313.1 hypothetical protein NCLIV_043790 [Neospora caninum Liverpool]CEL68628.1 TPA: hypothetical protein BN1204_043790 [Neospora caninum Liverpool]|eukprot:XP_003881346.1 hypothetical protein NCLIV_043790 [Neospora caninum Liverpool]
MTALPCAVEAQASGACQVRLPVAGDSGSPGSVPAPQDGLSVPRGAAASAVPSDSSLAPSSLGGHLRSLNAPLSTPLAARAPLWCPALAAGDAERANVRRKEPPRAARERPEIEEAGEAEDAGKEGTGEVRSSFPPARGEEACTPRLGQMLGSLPTPTFSLPTQRGLPQSLLPPHLRRELSELRILDIPAGEALLLLPVYEQWWNSVAGVSRGEAREADAQVRARLCMRCRSREAEDVSADDLASGTPISSVPVLRPSSPARVFSSGQPGVSVAGASPSESARGEAAEAKGDAKAQDADRAKRRRVSGCGTATSELGSCAAAASPASTNGVKGEEAFATRNPSFTQQVASSSPSSPLSCASSSALPPVCDLAGFALHLMARDVRSAGGNIFPVNQKASQLRDGAQSPRAKVTVGSTAGRQTLDARRLVSLALRMQAHVVTAPSEEVETRDAPPEKSQNGSWAGARSESGEAGEAETEGAKALHRVASKREVRMILNAEAMLQEVIEELRGALKEDAWCSGCGQVAATGMYVHGERKDDDSRAVALPSLPHVLANLQGSTPRVRECVGRRLAALLASPSDVPPSAAGASPALAGAAFVSGVSVGGLGNGETLAERRRLFAASVNSAPLFRTPCCVRFLPLHRGGPLELLHALCCGADVIQGGDASADAERGIAYSFDPDVLFEEDVEEATAKNSQRGQDESWRQEDARKAQEMLESAVAAGLASRFLHLDLTSEAYRDDFRPIMEKRRGERSEGGFASPSGCSAEARNGRDQTGNAEQKRGTCRWSTVRDSRAYLHHLFNCAELMGPVLLLQHNFQCLLALFEVFRFFLQRGQLHVAVRRFLSRCCDGSPRGDGRAADGPL